MVALALKVKVPRYYRRRCPDCHVWLVDAWIGLDRTVVIRTHTKHAERDPVTGKWSKVGPAETANYASDISSVKAWCECHSRQRSHVWDVRDDGTLQKRADDD